MAKKAAPDAEEPAQEEAPEQAEKVCLPRAGFYIPPQHHPKDPPHMRAD